MVIGAIGQSFGVFFVALMVLIAVNIISGNIRTQPRRR